MERAAETSALFFVKTDRTWMAGGLAREGLGDTDKLLSRALSGDTISSVNSLFEGKLTKSHPLLPPAWGRMQALSSSQSFLTPSFPSFFHMLFFKSPCSETLSLPRTSYYPLFTVHISLFLLHIFSLFSFLPCHLFFPIPHLTDFFFFSSGSTLHPFCLSFRFCFSSLLML